MSNIKSEMEQLQSLKIGSGIQYLLNEAYKILGNPVLLHDMDYMAIAYTENIVTDDPIWNEFVTERTIGRDWLELYKNENFMDTAANAKKVTFLVSEKLRYDQILGKLFNCDSIQIGFALIKAYQPFLDDIPVLFEYFCNILNKELETSDYYRNYGQEYQETLINKLIEGSLEDKEFYTAHVESIYMNLKNYLYLAVVDITQCDPAHTKLSYFRDLFKQTQPAFKYSIYANYMIIIMSSDHVTLDVDKDINELNRLINQNNIYAGISSCFENLFNLQKYYWEAVNALHCGIKEGSDQCFFI